ncbi:MAG: sulfatase [Armatimonadota bacterium]
MSRRLVWIAAVVVAAGLVRLLIAVHSPQSPLTPGSAPDLRARLSRSWADLTAPRTPPRQPPPGRPFSEPPLTYSGTAPGAAQLRAAAKDAGVIICVLDAARIDHFACYGYPRDTTPNFDRMARDGVLFEQHFCQASQTRPSTISLLTGQYPDTHGQLANGAARTSSSESSPPTVTLESALAQAGFSTFLLSSSPVVSPEYGVGEDFQHTRPLRQARPAEPADPMAALVDDLRDAARRWKTQGGRFFAYIHVLPPHMPYRAPERMMRLFRGQPPRYWRSKPDFAVEEEPKPEEPTSWTEWGNLYDANLRWADSFLGELEQTLRQAGILEHTLLIVTADHGEAMREHGYAFHTNCPYDEALHVPLLIRFPGKRKPTGRVRALTQTIDLFPSILDLCRIPARADVQGKSLVPLLAGETRAVNDYLVSRTLGDAPCYVIRDARTTLFLHQGGRKRALYDMDIDPWQTVNLYPKERARAAALEEDFRAFARRQRYPPVGFLDSTPAPARGPARPPTKLTDEQRRTLRALGYVE